MDLILGVLLAVVDLCCLSLSVSVCFAPSRVRERIFVRLRPRNFVDLCDHYEAQADLKHRLNNVYQIALYARYHVTGLTECSCLFFVCLDRLLLMALICIY